MIGKAKCISHLKASLGYAATDAKEGDEIGRNNLIGNVEMLEYEMTDIHHLNHRCKNNTIRVELSPDPKDIKKFNNESWRSLAFQFVRLLSEKVDDDLNDHQWVAFKHDKAGPKNNIDRPHIHIYINRIGFDGKATKDKFIGKKAQLAAHELAKKNGLISARDVMDQKINKGNSSDLKTILVKAAKQSKNLDDFIVQAKKMKIEVLPHRNIQGEIAGLKVQYQNKSYKISDIHRSLTLNRIDKLFNSNEQKRGIPI